MLRIEEIIQEAESNLAATQGSKKTAEDTVLGLINYGQTLALMAEDCIKTAQENGDSVLQGLGEDLWLHAEGLTGGLSKMAAESYDLDEDYVVIAAGLNKLANFMGNLAEANQDEVMYKYAEGTGNICNAIAQVVGVGRVNEQLEKGAGVKDIAKGAWRWLDNAGRETGRFAGKHSGATGLHGHFKAKGWKEGFRNLFKQQGEGLDGARTNALKALATLGLAGGAVGGGVALARRK